MTRKMYQMTEQQLKKCHPVPEMPSDAEFKDIWKKAHHGKVTGWGMGKRDWMLGALKSDPEYQRGIWQGRVDKARGLDYSEERNESAYNLGYYRGYAEYESNHHGWDQATRERFDSEYVNN